MMSITTCATVGLAPVFSEAPSSHEEISTFHTKTGEKIMEDENIAMPYSSCTILMMGGGIPTTLGSCSSVYEPCQYDMRSHKNMLPLS